MTTMEQSIQGQITYLQHENDLLREQLANAHDALFALSDTWPPLGLSPQCESIARTLYKNYPRVVHREAMFVAMYAGRPDCDWADQKIMDVQICRIRKILPKGGVETIWGRGWRLSPIGFQWLTKRLEKGAQQ